MEENYNYFDDPLYNIYLFDHQDYFDENDENRLKVHRRMNDLFFEEIYATMVLHGRYKELRPDDARALFNSEIGILSMNTPFFDVFTNEGKDSFWSKSYFFT